MVDIVGLAEALPVPSIEAWLRSGKHLTLVLGEQRFTQFAPADAGTLHAIRDHESVRPFMPSTAPLPMERHLAWVQAQLLTPGPTSPLVLVGRAKQGPLGFGLLKPAATDVLEVGAMVLGPWQNSALPASLVAGLVAVARQVFGARALQTHVNQAHAQALRFNSAWGLREAPSDKTGERCLQAPVAEVLATPLYRRSVRGLRIEIRE